MKTYFDYIFLFKMSNEMVSFFIHPEKQQFEIPIKKSQKQKSFPHYCHKLDRQLVSSMSASWLGIRRFDIRIDLKYVNSPAQSRFQTRTFCENTDL